MQNGRSDTAEAEVVALLAQAKEIASRYYLATGRPLGVTGEVAEYEAIRVLGLTPAIVRQEGYDATREVNGRVERLQIKGRRLHEKSSKAGPRIGTIDLRKSWDVMLFVVLDNKYEALEIFEANRQVVNDLIQPIAEEPDSFCDKLPVRKFIRAARRIWYRPNSAAPRKTDYDSWLGLGKKDGINPHPRFQTDDDLWE